MYVLHALLFAVFFSKVKDGQALANGQWAGKGTTRNLEAIVTGRCYSYIQLVNPSVEEKNCSQIWEAFKDAFVNKDPCSVLSSDYERYINLTLHQIPPNKSLFWENNKPLVHAFSDRARRFMPLGDALMGWLVDGLKWCGKTTSPGMDYSSCPTTEECEHNAVESFWRIASATYARSSSGIVYVLLNGSTPGGAFPTKSYFADYELPNFQIALISHFEIWVMDEIEGPDLDSCGMGSLNVLGSRLHSRGYKYNCTDNYRPIQLLQCVDFPDHPECSINSLSCPLESSLHILLPLAVLFTRHGHLYF